MPAPGLRVGSAVSPSLTVLGRVGAGGGGNVYIVWHHGRWCPMACKVFTSWRRARREAVVLRSLDHPNIVRFLGLGRPAHVLMDFLEGPSLSRLIRSRARHRLGVSDAVRVAMHLGAALTHIHERGFLHLDVKPSNIIVAAGRPVLFDFSTARPRRGEPLGHPAGTDPFMAPEQCNGGRVTPASDVFGFGVTLCEALTGQLPFPQGTRRNPFPQTAVAPTALRRHVPAISAELEGILLACLARDPADRPSLPGDILPSLPRFIRHGPAMWPSNFDPVRPRAQRSNGR
jgi:eukaryotic-like serine/threonine-protein kinase